MLVLSAVGTAQEFKRRFETPILRGRDAAATDDEHRKGEQKLQEVNLSFNSGQVLLFLLSLRGWLSFHFSLAHLNRMFLLLTNFRLFLVDFRCVTVN